MSDELHIRCSLLPDWNDCPRRSAARAFRPILLQAGFSSCVAPPVIGAMIGTAVHAGVAAMVEAKYNARSIDAKTALDVSVSNLESALSESEEITWDDITGTTNAATKQMSMMLRAYSAQILPHFTPEDWEVERTALITLSVNLTGHSDIETVDAVIRDTKTGRKLSSYHSQLGGYSLLKRSHGTQPEGLVIDYLPRVSLTKPYPGARSIIYDVETCEAEAWNQIHLIARQVTRFQKTGNPAVFPANPKSMICSPKYCSVYGTEFCRLGVVL